MEPYFSAFLFCPSITQPFTTLPLHVNQSLFSSLARVVDLDLTYILENKARSISMETLAR